MKRLITAACLLVAAGLGILRLTVWASAHRDLDSPRDLRRSAEERADTADLQRRVQRLERVQGASVMMAAALSRKGENAPAAEQQETPAEGLDSEEIKRNEKEQFDLYFAGLDHVRESERKDAAWASEVAQLTEKVAAASKLDGLALKVGKVDCGATLCRVEILFRGETFALAPRGIMAFVQGVGQALPEASVFNDQDNRRAIGYFARRGTSLPRM
jgi:hypothetical protein